jgi:hypothetical protein
MQISPGFCYPDENADENDGEIPEFCLRPSRGPFSSSIFPAQLLQLPAKGIIGKLLSLKHLAHKYITGGKSSLEPLE